MSEPDFRARGLGVACPYCHAAVGERCVSLTRKQPTQFNHGIRNDVAAGHIPSLYAVAPDREPCAVCGEPQRHYAGTVIAIHKPGCQVAAAGPTPRKRSGSSNRQRQEKVTVRLTVSELARLREIAAERHLPVGALLREAALTAGGRS